MSTSRQIPEENGPSTEPGTADRAPGTEAGTDPEAGTAAGQAAGAAVAAAKKPAAAAVFPGLLEIVRSLMAVLVVALFILTFIVQPFRIPSESMERTLLVGDFLLVNKAVFAPAGHWGWLLPYEKIQRGDVVVFHFPPHPPEHVVKRVIGLPGDRVHLEDAQVFVNGEPVEEPYAVYEPSPPDIFRDNFPTSQYTDPEVGANWWATLRRDTEGGDLVVPPGEYFVLGDNRNFSLDSRYWGFVPRKDIVGRPFVIYFSLREPSQTDLAEAPSDRLGQKNDPWQRIMSFARWKRFMRVVR
jgi:signal peptidase I